jgi:hypothetical protein
MGTKAIRPTRGDAMRGRLHNSARGSAFSWSATASAAALAVALDDETDEQIAAAAGVSRRTLANWKVHPDFAARVDQHRAEFHDQARRRGIALVANRVAALDDRWRRLRRVIAERAADPAMRGVPGGTTGLLVRDVRAVGRGEEARPVDVYRLDIGLLRELRELEKQAAVEVGDWNERRDDDDLRHLSTGQLWAMLRALHADGAGDPGANGRAGPVHAPAEGLLSPGRPVR